MAEFEKYNDFKDVEHLLRHYARANRSGKYSNPMVDTKKIYMDYNIGPDRGTYKEAFQYLKGKLQEISPRQRKDGVKMCDWVITLPTTVPSIREKEFFHAVYLFLVDRYGTKSGMGEDVVLSAYIHRSETQPHLHFSFMPVIERNGEKTFCAKDLIDRQELRSFHTDLESYLVERGICKKGDICTGITKAQGGNRSVRQLKRETARDRADRERAIKAYRELEDREKATLQREETLSTRERKVTARENAAQQREDSLDRKEKTSLERESSSRWDRNNNNSYDRGESRW